MRARIRRVRAASCCQVSKCGGVAIMNSAISRRGEPLNVLFRGAIPHEAEGVSAAHRKCHGFVRYSSMVGRIPSSKDVADNASHCASPMSSAKESAGPLIPIPASGTTARTAATMSSSDATSPGRSKTCALRVALHGRFASCGYIIDEHKARGAGIGNDVSFAMVRRSAGQRRTCGQPGFPTEAVDDVGPKTILAMPRSSQQARALPSQASLNVPLHGRVSTPTVRNGARCRVVIRP